MCLVAFAWKVDSNRPLILLANRDEFFDRPSAAMREWHDSPKLLAGRDLRAGGTWLGFHRDSRRLGVVTNIRSIGGGSPKPQRYRSRGALIPEFLASEQSAESFAQDLVSGPLSNYEGFNLLLFDGDSAVCVNNRTGVVSIEPGVHGLSNAQLNTPWPKVDAVKTGLEKSLQMGCSVEEMENIMRPSSQFDDKLLPNTGVPLDWERKLSAVCIDHDHDYGTRALTSVCVNASGLVALREWSRQSLGDPWALVSFEV